MVDKQGRKIQDEPENYALLISMALKTAIKDNPKLAHILIDRHLTYITQREKFNRSIQKKLNKQIFIEHVDSLQNPVITLVDFVAGAIRIVYVKQILRFKECIKDLIIEDKLVSWAEIKKR